MLLFYSTDAIALTNAAFGEGEGPIFLDNLRCLGREANLLGCLGATIGIQSCSHSEDAGVYCGGEWIYISIGNMSGS